jgi:hypothetical protein
MTRSILGLFRLLAVTLAVAAGIAGFATFDDSTSPAPTPIVLVAR